MSPLALILLDWALMAGVMAVLWRVQLRTGEADNVDLGWTVGLGVAAVLYAFGLEQGLPERRLLVAGLAVLWSARLATHLLERVRESGEDGRYAELRSEWGRAAPWRFLRFYQIQAVSVPLIAGQFMLAMLHPAGELRIFDALGALVVLVSVGARPWPTGSSRRGSATRRTAAGPAAAASGGIPGTRTTSSSGSTGSGTP